MEDGSDEENFRKMESFMSVADAQLRVEMVPKIECAFINKRSGAKHGEAFLAMLNELDGVHCQVHDLATEDDIMDMKKTLVRLSKL